MSAAPGTLASPAFAAARALVDLDALAAADDVAALQRCLDRGPGDLDDGPRLRLVVDTPAGAAQYERRVRERDELCIRPGTWHDRFNVLAWRLFPRTKAAINARHVAELDRQPGPLRSRVRDALTAFDEDGAIVALCEPDLATLVREFRWSALFVDARPRLADAFACVPFGHGLMEKLLDPFIGITAKSLLVPVTPAWFALPWPERLSHLDAAAAATIAGPQRFATPRELAPLPVLGIPGWWPGNDDARFYENRQYFRPGRRDARR